MVMKVKTPTWLLADAADVLAPTRERALLVRGAARDAHAPPAVQECDSVPGWICTVASFML
jgi:hypothetical protein